MATILQFGKRNKKDQSTRQATDTDHQATPPQAVEPTPKRAMPETDANNGRAYFEDLFEQGRQAVNRGEIDQAIEICDQAFSWAREYGNSSDADRATCNRYAIYLNTGKKDVSVWELQGILMRNSSALNRHLAAHNISLYYELQEEYTKSRFYADLALDHAKQTKQQLNISMSCMRLGNLLIRESMFSDATRHFESALDLLNEDELYKRLSILTSVGFCNLACGRISEGFEKLFTVRKSYLRVRLGPSIASGRLRLALCFGYLEIEKFHQALLHGKVALATGEECGDRELIKKSLYLLGEAAKLAGDEMKAYTYFAYLQEEFYPDNPVLPEILLYSNTNKLVNVWA